VSPSAQALPQKPQLFGSVVVSAHPPPQHICPAPHVLPQEPQLFGSDCVSTHPLPQHICSPSHVGMHAPLLQVSQAPQSAWPPPQLPDASQCERQLQTPASQAPDAQTWPHWPQLFGSVSRFEQVPLHSVSESRHRHSTPPPAEY
jgi:hypothetical protein